MPRLRRKWVPYDIAAKWAQQEGCRSRTEYRRWHDRVHPHDIPKMPERVYMDEWTSWNDFLMTDNSFHGNHKGTYRPYWDAARWCQEQGYESKKQFREAHLAGNIPKDIPLAPEGYYHLWNGWKVFLGLNLRGKLMMKENIQPVFALLNMAGEPENIITFVYEKGGMNALEDRWVNAFDKFKVLRTYVHEDAKYKDVRGIMEMLSTPHRGDENKRVVSNINTMYWELDSILEPAK